MGQKPATGVLGQDLQWCGARQFYYVTSIPGIGGLRALHIEIFT